MPEDHPARLQPVTLADVAEAAGVARSTVSKALRGYRSIPESTRARILETAERLGYRPNPMVSALMAQLHTKRRRQDMSPVLAVVHAWEVSWSKSPKYRDFARGARERCERLGFQMEEFSLRDDDLKPQDLSRIFQTRGIQGVLFAQAPDDFRQLPLDISHWSCATLGPSLERPKVHRAGPDHYMAMRLAMKQAIARGYRRLGFAVSAVSDKRLHGIWRSAFLGRHEDEFPERPPIPVHRNVDDNFSTFREWFLTHEPELIIHHALPVTKWLSALDRGIPGDVATLQIGIAANDTTEAGIDLNVARVGAEAVNLVVNQIHQNQRGEAASPLTLLVEPAWHEGPSAPCRKVNG